MKKKKEAKTERKIHRDFTLQEFDVFTMDLHCEGAADERNDILAELTKRNGEIYKLMLNAGLDSDLGTALYNTREGVKIAMDIIKKMKPYESRCECSDCAGCK
jgi:hypothetical protein